MAGKGKEETVFFCSSCGYESKKWMGQCPACRTWGAFAEEPVVRMRSASGVQARYPGCGSDIASVPISSVDPDEESRIDTGFEEFSRVLGGGIVPGSLILIGGDPGIGKSTLLLQTAANIAASGSRVVYISGEESLRQIRLRADRIGTMPDELRFVTDTDIDRIISLLEKEKPSVCVIDSVQTMFTAEAQSVAGSVTQVRECAQRMMRFTKSSGTAAFLVGHVTKEGTVAGPRVLEHIVDTVVFFESGDQFGYRFLRSVKNRFGSTNEIGVFEMSSDGLRAVANPSEYLLEGRPVNTAGTAVTCLMEGSRPVLMEVQGLVSETQYNLPRRQTNGIDFNRLSMLLAVLSKRAGIDLGRMDAYVNITGGMRVTEPSADLAVIAVLISAAKNRIIPPDTVLFGEVGLSGEVRAVPQASERVREAVRLGFRHIILPKTCLRGAAALENVKMTGIAHIGELSGLLSDVRKEGE
ncbi:MAG: DNA repair protein RadA [Eubacteriales bacterium]|nr:DNA repair protein RadA [Eubacteriales bacterium]